MEKEPFVVKTTERDGSATLDSKHKTFAKAIVRVGNLLDFVEESYPITIEIFIAAEADETQSTIFIVHNGY